MYSNIIFQHYVKFVIWITFDLFTQHTMSFTATCTLFVHQMYFPSNVVATFIDLSSAVAQFVEVVPMYVCLCVHLCVCVLASDLLENC